MNINWDVLARQIHATAEEKGFWEPYEKVSPEDDFIFYAKQLAMVHSEATEVLEAIRKDKGEDSVVEELADIIIRVFDLWAGMEKRGAVRSSLDQTMINKMNINESRSRLHGVKG